MGTLGPVDIDALLRERSERDRFLAEHYASPLPEEHREAFAGLDYFAPDPAWVVPAAYVARSGSRTIRSSAGSESEYRMVGEAAIVLEGREYRLTVLDDGDCGRFIPFRDRTCGDTTYGGGRYVGIDDEGVVDFNRARNPWCVYDEEFSCPLPPSENEVDLEVTAGEKMWRPAPFAPSPPA